MHRKSFINCPGLLGIVMLIFALSVLPIGCGGGGGDTDGDGSDTGDNGDDTGGDGDDTGGGGTTSPAINGFNFNLQEGDFWEYRWDYSSSYVATGVNNKSSYSGTFRVSLGPAITVDGVVFYEMLISGTTDAGDDEDVSPSGAYLAVSDYKLLILDSDATTITTLFDAQTGQWPGSGFFTNFPDNTLFSATVSTINNDYINTQAYMVEESSSSSQCEYFPGIGNICGGDYNENLVAREYYIEDVGPVGYYAYFSISDPSSSDGGWWASNTTHIGLTASSHSGDTVDYTLEVEPNNQIAEATAITIPAKVKGQDVSETYLGGTTEVSVGLSSVIEAEPNDTPFEPQLVNLPSSITADAVHGDGETGDDHTLVSDLPSSGGGTYSPTFEDWYEITLETGKTLNLTLDFPGTDADIDMYLFSLENNTSVETHAYSTDDNVASDIYKEEMSPYLSAGIYYVAIDAYDTTAGRADYTLEISTADSLVDICDWFSFSLISEAQVTVAVTGGPIFVLMDNAGANTLTSGGAADTSITLSAGSYLIGVSQGGPYTLEITSP